MRITLALLAVMIACVFATGCGGEDPKSANKVCASHGGVLATDSWGGLVTCGDRVARSSD